MKKKLLCLSFVLLLLLSCGIQAGAAEFVFYNLYVGGKIVSSANAHDVFGDGTVSYDADTSTLTLRDADIKGAQLQEMDMSMGIYCYSTDLTIVLEGDSVVADSGGYEYGAGIQVYGGDLTVKEGQPDSSLSVVSGDSARTSYGICVYSSSGTEGGVFTLEDATVSVDSGVAGFSGAQHCVGVEANFLDIRGGVLSSRSGSSQTARSTGIYLEGGLRLEDATLDAKSDISSSSYGVYLEGNGEVINSHVTVLSGSGVDSYGLAVTEGTLIDNSSGEVTHFDGGTLTIDGDSRIDIRGGHGETTAVGVYTENDFVVKDGKVSIFSADAVPKTSAAEQSFSYGLYTHGAVRIEGGETTVTGGNSYNAYGIYSALSAELIGGQLSVTSGRGHYSCGICAPVIDFSGGEITACSVGEGHYSYGIYAQESEDKTGVMKVSGDANVTSRAGVAEYYSDAIVTDELFDVSGGTVNAYGGEIWETSYVMGYPPDSSGVWSYGKINISAGRINAYAKAIGYDKGRSIGLSGNKGIYISSGVSISGAKEAFSNGDTEIIPLDISRPVTITSKGYTPYAGDVNDDGEINIKDATAIQKHLAWLIELDSGALAAADFDEDETVTIKDATAIQKFIAGLL